MTGIVFNEFTNSFLEIFAHSSNVLSGVCPLSLFSTWSDIISESERLCQDPTEKFFGCQRQRGYTNENLTVAWCLRKLPWWDGGSRTV